MTARAPHAEECARVTLMTCIGCGAMTLPGSCPGGCGDERRVQLVPAGAYDELAAAADAVEGDVRELRTALRRLAVLDGEPADPRAAWREFAVVARGALRRLGASKQIETPEVEAAEGWRCARCGGIDAPRPCLGVCIRHPAEWVAREDFESLITRHEALVHDRDRVAGVLGLAAGLTPRPGCELANWQALQARARAEAGVTAAPGRPRAAG